MTARADEVYEAGLGLDRRERAIVVQRLLESLHPDAVEGQEEVDAVWRDEIDSRVDEILNGKVSLVDVEESRRRLRERLAELRR